MKSEDRSFLHLTGLVLATVVAACGSDEATREVTVVGTDYAFEGPDTLSPGPTAFAFDNRGMVGHEMVLVRLKEGATLEQMLERERSGGNPEELTEGSAAILIAMAGQKTNSRILVDLLPNRTYALICGFRDTPEAPRHTELGMIASFVVK